MNKTINQLDEIASAELTDEAVIFDLSDSDTKKMTMQKAFNAMHKLSSTSVADSADELALYDSANNVTKKITKQNLLSEIQPPIIASSTTINGPAVEEGLYIKVIFTSAISASDTVTPLEINYNGDSVPVKVMKSGVASDILAHEISSGVYSYLQAMVTFEMVYSSAETAFILVGNPIVLSSTDYTIYADGQINYYALTTTEIKTNELFMGKPVYKKLIDLNYQSLTDSTIVGVLSGDEEFLIGGIIVGYRNSQHTSLSLCYPELYQIDNTNNLSCVNRATIYAKYLIFKYTKTTD